MLPVSHHLPRHPVLDALNPERAKELLSSSRRITWRGGRTVQAPGATETVLLLLSGAARFALPDSNGRIVLGGFLAAPSVFGAVEAIAERATLGSLTTLAPAEAILVPRALFVDAVRGGPKLAELVIRDTALRLMASQDQQRGSLLAGISERLAQVILAYGLLSGATDEKEIRIAFSLSQNTFVDDLGVSRSAVRYALDDLAQLVHKVRGRFVIVDKQGLRSRASGDPKLLINSLPVPLFGSERENTVGALGSKQPVDE
ncbi:MAG: Crp/Fnr family transcriptional regulator [Myxococcaceae bacterium]